MSLDSVWNRIQAWHNKNCPADLFTLAPGASDQEINQFESQTGLRLPEDVKLSYRLHNGALYNGASYQHGWLCHHGEFLPLSRMLDVWRLWRDLESKGFDGEEWQPMEIEGPIDPHWMPATRIPLTDNSGDGLFIDTVSDLGTDGQIIAFDHEIGPTSVLAGSWSIFLEGLADELEGDRYSYIDEHMTVMPSGVFY